MPDQLTDFISRRNVVALAGGVGGAKLAAGLTAVVPPEQLTIVVNTGDDFQHLGLTICPDLDTVVYTLGGVANAATGWGRGDESWRTMGAVAALGGPDWFRLGDLDLATHLVRAQGLQMGKTLTAVTADLCRQLHIQPTILPMSNQPAATQIATEDGRILPFQVWFVQEQWQPPVREVVLPDDVRATPQVIATLEKADVVVIAPSNPFVSIAPILNTYPLRALLQDLPEVVVAVSPIVGGTAVKGPAARMMQTQGLPVSPASIADYYGDLIDGLLYDVQDDGALDGHTTPARSGDTMMVDAASRERVARDVLAFAADLVAGF